MKAERLRIVLRRTSSGPQSFAEVLEILAIPTLPADLIENRSLIEDAPGYAVREPAGLLASLRELAAITYDGSTWFWSRFARARPRAWVVADVIGLLLSLILATIGISLGRVSGYIALVASVVWLIDLLMGLAWKSAHGMDGTRAQSADSGSVEKDRD